MAGAAAAPAAGGAALEAAALALADACDWAAAGAAFEAAAAASWGDDAARAAPRYEMAAQAWLEGGDAARAATAAAAATRAAPEFSPGWATLGRALRNGGDFARAAEALHAAARLLPPDADALLLEAAEARELAALSSARALPLPSGGELRLLEADAPPGCAACAREPADGGGPAGRVWEAGVVLARWLALGAAAGAPSVARKRVLDLGAGTGAAGLAAAALGARVTLSDAAHALPLLRRNASAAANVRLLAAAGGTADVACLDWHAPDAALADAAPWELLLAADCVYTSAMVLPFCGVLARLLRAGRAGGAPQQLLLAHKERDAAVTAALLQQVAELATVHEVPFEQHDAAFRTPAVRLFACTPRAAEADAQT